MAIRYGLIALALIISFGAGLAIPNPQQELTENGEGPQKSIPEEEASFQSLYDKYQVFLTQLASVRAVNLSDANDLTLDGFARVIGFPSECGSVKGSLQDMTVTSSIRDEVSISEGNLKWVRGSIMCQSISLPWDAIVAFPASQSPPKGVLILVHGTASSPEQLFGISTGDYPPDYSDSAGLKGLRDGFVVISPRVLTDLRLSESGYNYLRGRIDRRAQAVGARLIGIEQAALLGLISNITQEFHLESLPKLIYGVSLGGLTAFYQAAINPKIDAVIVSQWLEDRTQKQAGAEYEWADWRFETGDYAMLWESAFVLKDEKVASLIHPRPLGVEVGSEDPRAEAMKPVLEKLLFMYKDNPKDLVIEIVEGGHEMFYNPVVDRMWSALEANLAVR